MKKKIFLTALAIVAIAGIGTFSAFTANKTAAAEQWYQFDGSGDRTLPENYVLAGSSSPTCSGNEEVCAIKAMDNGFDQPEITSGLAAEINTAISEQEASAHVNLREN